MPKQVKARAAHDEGEERTVRKLARNHHAPADWVNHARMVVESWAGKNPNEIAAELACHPQTVRIHLARFNAEGIEGLGTSRLEELLRQLAKKQDDETMREVCEAYEIRPGLLTLASLELVLGSVLDPMFFQNRNESTQGLKQAYQLMPKGNTNLDKLRGAIGLVCFTLELLDVAKKQNQDQTFSLDWPNKLLGDSAVRDWFKEVYAPPEQNRAAIQNSPTKRQEEENLNYWGWLDFEELKVYRVGTTSFILRCQPKAEMRKLVGKDLVLKCLLYPYTRIDDITEATRRYALRYSVDKEPETNRVIPHVYASTDRWILMDFVKGETLREFLQKHRNNEKMDRPPLLRTSLLSSIGKPLLEALEMLETSSLPFQHEDLTPSNIIVRTKQDETIDGITFIDLGRNYLYSGHIGLETRQDARFVAPEVKRGESSGRADLYSFGMILIELADPIGVQGDTIPDSLYQYAPYLARFIEDLIDEKPENRLLIFHPESGQNLYTHLRIAFEDLLKVYPPEREVKPGRFFWVQQFIALFFPKEQLTHAWKLWCLMHPDFRWWKFWHLLRPSSTHTEIARYTGRLYGWLVVSTFGWWLVFLVSIVWGTRDFGMNPFSAPYISIPQTLLPGCGGTCVPFIDALQAPGYHFSPGNFSARIVGITAALALAAYYQNILAGLTTKPMSGWRAHATEFSLRFILVYNPALILIGELHQPDWWLWLVVFGYPAIALTNFLCYSLATRTLDQAKKLQYNVPGSDDPSLKNFGQWWITLIVTVMLIICIGIGLRTNFLHDTLAYAFIGSGLNVFVLCISKGIMLAPGVRGSLCRAFTLGERLEVAATSTC